MMNKVSATRVAGMAAAAALVAVVAACSPLGANAVDASGSDRVDERAAPSTSVTALSSDGITSLNAEWLAETDPNYVYSDMPQSDSELWLAEQFPDQWALGVRAVSGQYVSGYGYDDPPHFAVTVQYIDGVRYEGTQETPLGFRGQTDDPDSIATDAYEAMIRNMGNSSLTQADVGNTGQGGYAVQIANDFQDHSAYTLTVVERQKNAADKVVMSEPYRSWEDAFAALESSGFSPTVGDRDLYPGEISVIERYEVDRDSSGKTISTAYVYNPETGQWVVAAEAG